jgi:ABC-2 type transport system ATP-binding protein
MIEVKKLTKRFGTFTAVDGVTFEAREGEILGILGPNGAGKTTIMRMLTGFMPPSEGTASIDGFDVVNESLDVRQRVGYMPERVPIYPDMTVEGYITFWARMRGVHKPRQQVERVLDRVELLDRRKSLIRNLSKGMRQRLGLAQALVHDPRVIILDEPTIGIDPRQVIEVRDSVRDLGHDHTVLFSTHILSEAEQVCDRVIIINNGHVVAQGKPDALRQKLQHGEHIFIEIEGGAEADILKLLSQTTGVRHVEPLPPGYSVRAKKGADIRGQLSQRVTQAGYKVLELRPVAMTLEDIFLDLVGRES